MIARSILHSVPTIAVMPVYVHRMGVYATRMQLDRIAVRFHAPMIAVVTVSAAKPANVHVTVHGLVPIAAYRHVGRINATEMASASMVSACVRIPSLVHTVKRSPARINAVATVCVTLVRVCVVAITSRSWPKSIQPMVPCMSGDSLASTVVSNNASRIVAHHWVVVDATIPLVSVSVPRVGGVQRARIVTASSVMITAAIMASVSMVSVDVTSPLMDSLDGRASIVRRSYVPTTASSPLA